MKHLLLALTTILLLAGCRDATKDTGIVAGETVVIDSLPGQSPYLAKDPRGTIVLSWVRTLNDSSSVLCYATSSDGVSFSPPFVIPGSENIEAHAENLPKIIVKPSGEMIALWGTDSPDAANKYAGLVYYAQSPDDGKTWSRPKRLVSDTAGYDQRYYDVALLPDGEAGIIWLDNRKTVTKEGSALYFSRTAGTGGFSPGRLISQPCCQCCRTALFTDSKGGIHAVYRAILDDSIRDIVHIVSTDDGQTFSAPQPVSRDNWVISGCPHTGPAMAENGTDLHFAWFTGGRDKGCFYTSSGDNGAHFAPRQQLSASGSHPQMVSLPGGQLLTVWDETIRRDDKFYKQIAIQQRSASGEAITMISPDTAVASYPVITTLKENRCLVAYAEKKGTKNHIVCRIVTTR
ncbi:MAG: exo-alpha-sialidase [Chitinophagaceae bacterium]